MRDVSSARVLLLLLSCVLLVGSAAGAHAQTAEAWAFEESFDGDPASPSQDLLPRRFDYIATHRTHPSTPDGFDGRTGSYGAFPADHGPACEGPPLQHTAFTTHRSDGAFPDPSFLVCRNHMMSSMGDVEGYSVSAFWPRQEFDFAAGGVLEFDVTINDRHPRSWWEVLIAPRGQQQFGAAQDWLPISETFPPDRILLRFDHESKRHISVGTGAVAPDGWIVEAADWAWWRFLFPDDPALDDRTIRRTMRITLSHQRIDWEIEAPDGGFDSFGVDVPGGLPFDRGLVSFKTHAYTPRKDDNDDLYTYHWDNIRFSGPLLPPYENFEAHGVVNLAANGSVPIGSNASQTIELPHVGPNPVLAGQVHAGIAGQVLVSINGHGPLSIVPHSGDTTCDLGDWRSYRVAIDPGWLSPGTNRLDWVVGPRPACATGEWDGFSAKATEFQFDGLPGAPGEASRGGESPLTVTAFDAGASWVQLAYDPGCNATDHVLYSGPLSDVAAASWDQAACGLGTSGAAGATLGHGDRFFVLVAQGPGVEGSYGRRSDRTERREADGLPAAACDAPQSIAAVCE